MQILVSVIVVSDYTPDMAVEKAYLERCLRALSDQDCEATYEVIVVLPEESCDIIGGEIKENFSDVKIVETSEKTSFQMKNAGARVAEGEILAFLDADCFADRGWIGAIAEGFEENSGYGVMTGCTYYKEQDLTARSFCMISRAIMNGSSVQSIRRLANHNCAFRREVFEQFPFPDVPTAFGGTVYASTLTRSEKKILYYPEMRAAHVYEGWHAESDIRRNNGYAGIAYRLEYSDLPYAWIVRWGYLSVPLLYFGRFAQFSWICVRRFREYGIRWYQLPYTFALASLAFTQEIPGMITALQRRSLVDTAYR
jgi:glycosyltransferase involved in cell wall biosynthesis